MQTVKNTSSRVDVGKLYEIYASSVILAHLLHCDVVDKQDVIDTLIAIHRLTVTQFLHSFLCQLFWPPCCMVRKRSIYSQIANLVL